VPLDEDEITRPSSASVPWALQTGTVACFLAIVSALKIAIAFDL
jgi:hypothetical protein